MTDNELIQWLFDLLWDDLTDGNIPSDDELTVIKQELLKRGLNPQDLADNV